MAPAETSTGPASPLAKTPPWDESTKEIVAVEVAPSRVHDSRVLPTLLDEVPGQVRQVSNDRDDDTSTCYETAINRGAAPAILPQRNARLCAGKAPPA